MSALFSSLCATAAVVMLLSVGQREALATTTGISVCPMYVIAKHLVYPETHASHVSTKLGTIVVSGVDSNASLTLEANSATAIVTTTTKRVASNTGFVIPVLHRHTTYRVIVRQNPQHGAQRSCPNNMPAEIGSFSTK